MLGWWIYHKLARAEKHIDEVEADIARFLADRPYGLTNDFTPNADGTVTWTRRAKIEPQGWVVGSIAFPIGDAIHNMRALSTTWRWICGDTMDARRRRPMLSFQSIFTESRQDGFGVGFPCV